MKLIGNYYTQVDRGLERKTNEDFAVILTNSRGDLLLLVADGMGGHVQGNLAAKIAIDTLAQAFKRKSRFWGKNAPGRWLSKFVRIANAEIHREAENNPEYRQMGTTLVAAIIRPRDLTIVNVGDSRAYWLNQGKLEMLTEDQTLVAYLAKTGQIKPEEKKTHPRRHVLINALGVAPSVSLDLFRFPYHDQDVLLCSDGLYNLVNDQEIEAVLLTSDSVEEKAALLVTNANKNGGLDNIAIALWEREL
ncbi:MAG: Stp1/IreP family PP2C-type Ser/Thr phosphatase [Bacilli bacterium]|jgi:serine/threonine protein phosphatase PrpC